MFQNIMERRGYCIGFLPRKRDASFPDYAVSCSQISNLHPMWLSLCILELMVTVPPGQYLLSLETFWVVMCSLVLLASSERRPRILLNIVMLSLGPCNKESLNFKWETLLYTVLCVFMSSTLKDWYWTRIGILFPKVS